jgi:hypothetical protein
LLREPLLDGNAVALLVQTSLDQLLLTLRILLTSFTKQGSLMRRSTVLSLSLQLVFPGFVDGNLLSENGVKLSSYHILEPSYYTHE